MANIWWTYGEYTANIRRIYGEYTADMRQKLPRTYGEHTLKTSTLIMKRESSYVHFISHSSILSRHQSALPFRLHMNLRLGLRLKFGPEVADEVGVEVGANLNLSPNLPGGVREQSHTLLRHIKQHVRPGSIIITDGWRGYFNLTRHGYFHEDVTLQQELTLTL